MSDIQNDKLQFTCLYDRHVALGAKMSPFAGFMMPIQYDSITVEHNAVRQKAGVFDVSHMGEIFISGKDAEKFVNHIFTNEIRGFEPGKVLYGMMCYPDGGVVDDLLVYRESEPDHFLLVVNAANIDKDFAWIKENIEGFDCKAVNASSSWGQVAIQGPDAEKVVTDVLGFPKAAELGFYTFYDDEWKGSRLIISRTGYTGEDGFELYTTNEGTCEIWDILMKAGVQPCGLGCRDTLRFEAGLPLYGDELSDKISPVVAGLGIYREHSGCIAYAKNLFTCELPVDISGKSCKECNFGNMLFLVQNCLIEMSYAPSLRNMISKEFCKFLRSLLCYCVSPGSKRNKKLSVLIKCHISMHHCRKSHGSDLLKFLSVFALNICGKIFVTVPKSFPDIVKSISPDSVFQSVLPSM